MNDIENLTEEDIALLEANFPHGELTDDQHDAWLHCAYLCWYVITDTEAP